MAIMSMAIISRGLSTGRRWRLSPEAPLTGGRGDWMSQGPAGAAAMYRGGPGRRGLSGPDEGVREDFAP
ncbi:hypothetical protein AA958_21955 [Streptomyces sp. CNQ-509]|nr:hypothetical protein AA958_21955 [Streptomyces sp. CNQ-509]